MHPMHARGHEDFLDEEELASQDVVRLGRPFLPENLGMFDSGEKENHRLGVPFNRGINLGGALQGYPYYKPRPGAAPYDLVE